MIKRTMQNGVKLLLVDDLNPEDNEMFQAKYARSAAGAEVILEEVYAARREAFNKALVEWSVGPAAYAQDPCGVPWVEKEMLDALMAISGHNDTAAATRKLMPKFLVGYGHKSIADTGSTTLCAEGCSMLAAKAIQDWPLYSGQETSTRAINMSTQRIEDPIGTPESKAILDRWMAFYTSSQGAVEAEVRRRYPRQDGEDEKAYEGAVKYRVFDILRAFLPAGATTNVSWHTNLRQAGDHLTWMLHHPLAEVRLIAQQWQAMLKERYPNSGSFGGAAGLSGVGADGQDDERAVWYAKIAERFTYPPDSGPMAEWVFRNNLRMPMTAGDDSGLFDKRPRGCVLPHWLSDFGSMSWAFKLDFGSFRDLQRHRNGVCRMPILTPIEAFESWYLEQLPEPLVTNARKLINEQEGAICRLEGRDVDKQYYCAMGHRVRCTVTYALPAFVYLVELRSTKSVHPTLRTVVHQMIREFQKLHPEVPLHVDMTPDPWNVRRGTQTIERRANDGERKEGA